MLYSQNMAKKQLYHSDYLDEDIVDFLGGTFAIPQHYSCNVVPIERGYGTRPDLIADELYGDELYADIISKLNGPGNPFEMNDDNYIILPGADHIDRFIYDPIKEWSETYNKRGAVKPKPKNRSEKRKPNQAVIGDKRFNVDPLSKIVIY